MLGNRAFQYDPCKMYQINASERAANQSRLRETRLMLKLYLYGLDAALHLPPTNMLVLETGYGFSTMSNMPHPRVDLSLIHI